MYLEKRIFVEKFLKRIRKYVEEKKYDYNRLPDWIECSNIQYVKTTYSNLLMFEPSSSNQDNFTDHGHIATDLQFFFNQPSKPSLYVSVQMGSKASTKLILVTGTEEGTTGFVFSKIDYSFLGPKKTSFHSPHVLMSVFLEWKTDVTTNAIKFIPFALYVHDRDFYNFEIFWNKFKQIFFEHLDYIHESEVGDYHQKRTIKLKAELVFTENLVLVLGKYGEEKTKLVEIKDYLKTRNYEAYLLEDLPELSSWNMKRKTQYWALASQFNIILDLEPSGHIAEYAYVKAVSGIIALLRKKNERTTYMIGDKYDIDHPYIKIFEFKEFIPEILPQIIQWADDHIMKRKKATEKEYPWRNP